jgi:transporter family-2 protein
VSKGLVILLLILAGTFVSLQASINARLAKYIGFLEAAFVSFLVGTVTLMILILFRGENNLKSIGEVPIIYLTGGILGALFVFSITYAIHIVGVTGTLAISISVQLLIGLLLDTFDPMKVIKLNISIYNVIGVLFVILGVFLILLRK